MLQEGGTALRDIMTAGLFKEQKTGHIVVPTRACGRQVRIWCTPGKRIRILFQKVLR